MTTIDRNDAPEGYEARAANSGCTSCAFIGRGLAECSTERRCLPVDRTDKQDVIFVKRKPHLVATGGHRPTVPQWATGMRLYFRGCKEPTAACSFFSEWDWSNDGALGDILFVEWLP